MIEQKYTQKYIIRTATTGVMGIPTDHQGVSQVPAGHIVLWAGEEIPDGWLECDGSEYDPEEYPELHSVLSIEKRPAWWKRFLGEHPEMVEVYGERRLPDLTKALQ